MSNLAQLYLSGEVRRYHHNPAIARLGQSLADHQGRCVQLMLALHPSANMALVRAVAFHDVGELIAGDLGAPFKRSCPEIAKAHADFEPGERARITGCRADLTARETRWLRLIDCLEAHCFVLVNAPAEYERPASGWIGTERLMLANADFLGCGDAVRSLLHDLKGGNW